MELLQKAIKDSEKFEVQSSYNVMEGVDYVFKQRQEAYYKELLCRMYDLLKEWDTSTEKKEGIRAELLQIAKGLLVFSDPATEKEFNHINKDNNTLFVATVYYICGYEAIASLVLRRIAKLSFETNAAKQLYALIKGDDYVDGETIIKSVVLESIRTGKTDSLSHFVTILEKRRELFDYDSEREFFDEQMLRFALHKYLQNNLLSDLQGKAPDVDWLPYVQYSAKEGILSLLQSQREALDKGLLSFEGSFSLSMPTSAGKSYITELLIYQELARNPESKVLYLAPLRSLSRELGEKFEKIKKHFGYKIAVKYGGGSVSGNSLSDDIQILVSTPEFFISLEEGIEDLLEMYKLIICDEGQLLDDYSRGINYEMLLTRLRKCDDKRFLFISAIIPNISDINEWLGGEAGQIGDSKYRPSSIILTKAFVNNNNIDLEVFGEDYRKTDYTINGFIDLTQNPFDVSRNRGVACVSALQAVNAGPVMLYDSFKRGPRGCETFCDVILAYLNDKQIELPDFSRMKTFRKEFTDYVDYQCGRDYHLTNCIEKGLSFHHADIPQDIRELIEKGINNGSITIVVCTSTLAEGVNLPIKTIVLGNINDPLFPQSYIDRARLKNIIGRVGRAGRERYGLVVFPDNGKTNPLSLVQDALNDVDIPKVQGTLFRLVDYLVKKHNLSTNLNDLLGDNDLVAAIDLMITKSTDDENLDVLSIDDLIKDSLAFKLGDSDQKKMLKHVFEARYTKLKEQFDANEYALLKATGFSVRELDVAHRIIEDADVKYLDEVTLHQWPEVLAFMLHKVYQLPTINESAEEDSHKYVKDVIIDKDLMIKLCELWMAGVNYKDMTSSRKSLPIPTDMVIVSIIFVQNVICPKIRSLVNFIKGKYSIDNVLLNSLHELLGAGIKSELQLYLHHHGLRNRIGLHAIESYLDNKGISITEYEQLRLFVKKNRGDIWDYMQVVGFPKLAYDKVFDWAYKRD